MAPKTVLITAASGAIGKATIKALGQSPDSFAVKAGVRDPSKSADLAAIASNVSVVAADPLKEAEISGALQGVDYVFVIAPGHADRQKIAIAAIDAAKAAGAKFILVLSVSTAELMDTIFGGQFWPVEAHAKASGLPFTIIRLPLFMENNYGFAESIKDASAIYSSYEPDKPFTAVSVDDVGEAAAKIFADTEAHKGKTYNLTGPSATAADIAHAFSGALGKAVSYNFVPYEASKNWLTHSGFPEWQADGVIELFKAINAGAVQTNDPANGKTLETILGHPPTSVNAWAKAHAAAFA
ncbi:hypothetical protein CLOM_g12813 [Closterium sp. NIES-68]|nr:hypothetical protein CLOM_g5011 [Closterium sp. NIES-68]GJP53654.1 hypothetical protein CLOM_g12813 [Closterium sp. NIES-68]GJP67810.1 hypothetical protein CLOP_g24580 [Closterium sp. NIES-67]